MSDLKKFTVVIGAILVLTALIAPARAYLYTPAAVYSDSGHVEEYLSDRTIDGRVLDFTTLGGTKYDRAWVVLDDVTDDVLNPQVTGHIVLDMGAATTIQDAWIWARPGSPSTNTPKDVSFFYFNDDNPANVLGLIDDIEGDPNIVAAWSGTIDPILEFQNTLVSFAAPITKRYIGLRVDSSYQPTQKNFQIAELMFGAAAGTISTVPGAAPVAVNSYSNASDIYVPGNTFDDTSISDSALVPSRQWLSKGTKWVALDDDGGTQGVNGHIVYDMGSAMELRDMTIWSKQTAQTALPANVQVFRYIDDNPLNHVIPDDIEGDPGIEVVWSGTLKEYIYGLQQTVAFATPFTGRYIGVRVDSSYQLAGANFQMDEVRFNTGDQNPAALPGIGAQTVYAHSGEIQIGNDIVYRAQFAIDGVDFRGDQWSSNDDDAGIEGVSGHIVLDMGSATQLASATLWPREDRGDHGYGPKQVEFFCYVDDDPTNNTGTLDDIEGDLDIVQLWSGTLDELLPGQTANAIFSSSVTKRYIGLRIDSSWDTAGFQIGELRFNVVASNPIPGDATGDGYVDQADAAVLAGNWGASTSGGVGAGDFNADGRVNAADASILAANWNPSPAEGHSSVPEPAALALVAPILAWLTIRRRY